MSRTLTPLQIAQAAREFNFEEDVVRAVIEVESRGRGYDDQGRLLILFEPHIFYREVSPKLLTRAVSQGVAYRVWGTEKYPKDSYPNFSKAFRIDSVAALRSCSVGLGQIMGFNHVDAGYTTVHEMWDDFRVSEQNQLRGMLRFIRNTGLDDELQARNWAAFARGYNGPSYAVNRYDIKLRNAFAKWKLIPDVQIS